MANGYNTENQKKFEEFSRKNKYNMRGDKNTSKYLKRQFEASQGYTKDGGGGGMSEENLARMKKLEEGQAEAMKFKKMSEEFGAGGQKFAEGIIGEGFDRLGKDKEVQDALTTKKKSADELGEAARRWEKVADEGMGTEEMEAQKSMQQQQMSKSEQLMGYKLGAKGGGAKGSSSLAQTRSLMAAGAIGRAQLDQEMFVKNEAVKREGIAGLTAGLTSYTQSLDTYNQALGSVKQFDIGLQKTEKDIRLQAGLGFEEMKQSEINAKIQAEATIAAAAASRPSCFLPHTLIIMEDGSEKQIKDIDPGDRLKKGGTVHVIGMGKSINFYMWNGVPVGEGHCVKDKWGWLPVELSNNSSEITLNQEETYVINVVCENHEVVVKGSEARFGDWLDAEDKSYWSRLYVPYKRVRRVLNGVLSKVFRRSREQEALQNG